MGPGDGMESDDEDDAYDLREVSSDVEMHPDDLLSDSRLVSDFRWLWLSFLPALSRFEEVKEVPTTLKRPREADVEPDAVKLSKSEKKKKKKQKGDDGKAIEKPVEDNKLEEKEEETKKDKQEVADNKKSKQKPTESKKIVEKEITGGIKLLDAKLGTGPMAKKGNTVRMRYIGKLQNGKVFDKNVSGKPVSHTLEFCRPAG